MIITDRKLSDIVSGVPEDFRAEILNYTSLYPFEMEQDSSIADDQYTPSFRLYDARLGRWMSVDPVTDASVGPYVAMNNDPIAVVDPSGAVGEEGKEEKEATPLEPGPSGTPYDGTGNMPYTAMDPSGSSQIFPASARITEYTGTSGSIGLVNGTSVAGAAANSVKAFEYHGTEYRAGFNAVSHGFAGYFAYDRTTRSVGAQYHYEPRTEVELYQNELYYLRSHPLGPASWITFPYYGIMSVRLGLWNAHFVLAQYGGIRPGEGAGGTIINADGRAASDEDIIGSSMTIVGTYGGVGGLRNGSVGGVSAPKTPFALGLTDEGLATFAEARGATTWKDLPNPENWQAGVLEKLADPETPVHFNLDGVNVWQGI